MRDVILSAWAEYHSGPGWSNRLVCVLIRRENGDLHVESLQPDEHTATMQILFPYSARVNQDMIRAIESARRGGWGSTKKRPSAGLRYE